MTKLNDPTNMASFAEYDPDYVYEVFQIGDLDEAVDMVHELRDNIDDLPPTKNTFKLDHVFEASHKSSYMTIEAAMDLLGAWQVPQHYARGATERARWVNPQASDAYIYSPCYVECRCGTLMTFINACPGIVDGTSIDDHADDCRDIWRWRAKHEVWERRRAHLKENYKYDLPINYLLRRMGYAMTGTLNDSVWKLDLDPQALREEAKKYTAHTAVYLLTEYSKREIGDLLGISPNTVSRRVDEHIGDVDYHKYYEFRGVTA